jgi:hypothetical protein
LESNWKKTEIVVEERSKRIETEVSVDSHGFEGKPAVCQATERRGSCTLLDLLRTNVVIPVPGMKPHQIANGFLNRKDKLSTNPSPNNNSPLTHTMPL